MLEAPRAVDLRRLAHDAAHRGRPRPAVRADAAAADEAARRRRASVDALTIDAILGARGAGDGAAFTLEVLPTAKLCCRSTTRRAAAAIGGHRCRGRRRSRRGGDGHTLRRVGAAPAAALPSSSCGRRRRAGAPPPRCSSRVRAAEIDILTDETAAARAAPAGDLAQGPAGGAVGDEGVAIATLETALDPVPEHCATVAGGGIRVARRVRRRPAGDDDDDDLVGGAACTARPARGCARAWRAAGRRLRGFGGGMMQ